MSLRGSEKSLSRESKQGWGSKDQGFLKPRWAPLALVDSPVWDQITFQLSHRLRLALPATACQNRPPGSDLCPTLSSHTHPFNSHFSCHHLSTTREGFSLAVEKTESRTGAGKEEAQSCVLTCSECASDSDLKMGQYRGSASPSTQRQLCGLHIGSRGITGKFAVLTQFGGWGSCLGKQGFM